LKITYPHMGEAYIAVKGMFDDLGLESIIPPFTTNDTLRLGAKESPECVCLPFKITLGNYIKSLEAGADTIVITGSCGPCRFGYYGPLQKQILQDMGYHADFIIVDPPRENFSKFCHNIRRLGGGKGIKGFKSVYDAYKVCVQIDKLNEIQYFVRPRAKDKSKVNGIMHNFKSRVLNTHGTAEINNLIEKTCHKLMSISIDKDMKPIKIGIIGEIYTIIEPFSNLHVEERLGNMGAEVHRSMTVREWTENNIVKPLTGRKSYKMEKRLSKPYIPVLIGGHTQQCIGHAVNYALSGYDGLVQIYPMTCMPEIVSRSILAQVEKDYNIPVLYLIVDEQTGEAGYQTRLEAFYDYVESRKKNNESTKYLLNHHGDNLHPNHP
jgi:predicted nucleotide-binding protein (sugar kinase/HSP70/actin superfamily)